MAVVQTTLVARGQAGDFTLVNGEGGRRYVGVYNVEVSAAADGPAIVVGAVGLPELGDTYAFGNDADTSVNLVSLAPNRVDGTRLLWQVVATWETPDRNEGEDDPLEWEPEISVGFAQFTRPVTKAINVDQVGFILPNRKPGPIVNSRGTPYDPQPDRDDSRLWWRMTKFLNQFPWEQSREYQDAVNADAFFLPMDSIGLVLKFIQPREAKITNIGGSLKFQKNAAGEKVYFWPVTYEMQFKPESWRFEILDQGMFRRQDVGDPRWTTGDIISSSDPEFDDNGQKAAMVRDDNGVPFNGPVNFDGNGQPLEWFQDPVFHTWEVYEELPFVDLNLQV